MLVYSRGCFGLDVTMFVLNKCLTENRYFVFIISNRKPAPPTLDMLLLSVMYIPWNYETNKGSHSESSVSELLIRYIKPVIELKSVEHVVSHVVIQWVDIMKWVQNQHFVTAFFNCIKDTTFLPTFNSYKRLYQPFMSCYIGIYDSGSVKRSPFNRSLRRDSCRSLHWTQRWSHHR